MKLTTALLFLSLSSTAFAVCDESIKAAKLIDLFDKFEVNLPFSSREIDDVRVQIKDDKFCDGFSPISLCTALALDASVTEGDRNQIKSKNPTNQEELEQALLDYGRLFNDRNETQGFGCSLKNVNFPTIKNRVTPMNCSNSLERDLLYRGQFENRSSGIITVFGILATACFDKDLKMYEPDERVLICGGTLASLAGTAYWFTAATPALAIAGGIFGIGLHLTDPVTQHKDQFKTDKMLYRYFQNPNDKSVLRDLKRYYFPSDTTFGEIKTVMNSLIDTKELCSKTPQTQKDLKITPEGVDFLKSLGYVPMDIILNDDMPKWIKERVIEKHMYTTLQTYGEILSYREIHKAIQKKMDDLGIVSYTNQQ